MLARYAAHQLLPVYPQPSLATTCPAAAHACGRRCTFGSFWPDQAPQPPAYAFSCAWLLSASCNKSHTRAWSTCLSPHAAPAAGAPANNATFTSPDGLLYYSYMAKKANFSEAVRSCTALGGSLAMWKDGEMQYSVERYFYQVGWLTGQPGCIIQCTTWLRSTHVHPRCSPDMSVALA
jgi:hypothetical protein